MELKNQVCSLELAKKLKELGVKQESLFYWWENIDKIGEATLNIDEKKLSPFQQPELLYNYTLDCHYSAFTVAELGELLPENYGSYRGSDGIVYCTKFFDVYSKYFEEDNTEADARAKMLIYLIENNLRGKKIYWKDLDDIQNEENE